MNKEEKKALKDMKRFCNVNDMSCISAKQMETIVNLIDKLLEKNKDYYEAINVLNDEKADWSISYLEVVKENEHYKEHIEKLQKENEELKIDINNNYQMIALAQNEILGYMKGYEDGKKSNRSAVACVVENQQYYIIKKEIEWYKKCIEKLQNDNKYYKGIINKLYGETK